MVRPRELSWGSTPTPSFQPAARPRTRTPRVRRMRGRDECTSTALTRSPRCRRRVGRNDRANAASSRRDAEGRRDRQLHVHGHAPALRRVKWTRHDRCRSRRNRKPGRCFVTSDAVTVACAGYYSVRTRCCLNRWRNGMTDGRTHRGDRWSAVGSERPGTTARCGTRFPMPHP